MLQKLIHFPRQAALEYDCFSACPDALTEELAAKCRDHITQASSLARRPVVKRRIQSISRYWRATELQGTAQRAVAAWRTSKTAANRDAARNTLAQTAKYIHAVSDEFHLKNRLGFINGWLKEVDGK